MSVKSKKGCETILTFVCFFKSCIPSFTDCANSQFSVAIQFATKKVQWPILKNSHAYPFCKNHAQWPKLNKGQWNWRKVVAIWRSQWNLGFTCQILNSITLFQLPSFQQVASLVSAYLDVTRHQWLLAW